MNNTWRARDSRTWRARAFSVTSATRDLDNILPLFQCFMEKLNYNASPRNGFQEGKLIREMRRA